MPDVHPMEERITESLSRLCEIPATTLMVFTRKRLGFNTVSYLVLFLLYLPLTAWGFGVLFWSSVIGAMGVRSWWIPRFDPWLFLFAQAVLIVGIRTHYLRWKEFKQKKWWHSQSEGIPRLSQFLPDVPRGLMLRVVEPAFCFVISILVFVILSRALGAWLIWATICLAIHQQLQADLELKKAIDIQDALIATNIELAAAHGLQEHQLPDLISHENAKTARAAEAGVTARTYGLSTGSDAEEIRLQMERRRKRQLQNNKIDYGGNLAADEIPGAAAAGA